MDSTLSIDVIDVSINLNISINNKVAFYGDKKRIKQLVVILLDNALKYTDFGTVAVTLTQSEKEIIITATDTGHGIEDEHISKVFDRFYRGTRTRNLNQDGSGLGLSIAKWIVQEHGGVIHVASTPDAGSSFSVCLPNGELQI